jgi:UTP--glucose-1-phosphate uridylyltransferase
VEHGTVGQYGFKDVMRLDGAEKLIRQKMSARGIHPAAADRFLAMLHRISDVESGYVPLDEVAPPDPALLLDSAAELQRMAELQAHGEALLKHAAVVKLNGGRATTMGTLVPKGILKAKNGRSYLEIIIGQMAAHRKRWQADVPLVLMNSFFTHGPTMEMVSRCDVPVLAFSQNQVPRLLESSLAPLDTGSDEDWVPPGHGDVYESLKSTGLLAELISRGCRWAFISNLDNLAACLEPWILGLIDLNKVDFLLEVTDRTPADRKGGTLVVRDGHLDLIEIAQVAPEERDAFMDIERFRVFNTNNVWVDLEALDQLLETRSLNLPIIQNRKRIGGAGVIQLETAMGAAVGSFPRARGLKVGRDRFFPTKKVSDLFVLQSDACILDAMDRLRRNPGRPASLPFMPSVFFSPDFVDSPHMMVERFEESATVSLLYAASLEVAGAAFFERDVKIEGEVRITVPDGEEFRIPQGTILRNGDYP